jgi:hypothetical protein
MQVDGWHEMTTTTTTTTTMMDVDEDRHARTERVEVDPTSKICKRLITSTCELHPQSNHHLLPPIRMIPDSKEDMDIPVMEWNLDLDPR